MLPMDIVTKPVLSQQLQSLINGSELYFRRENLFTTSLPPSVPADHDRGVQQLQLRGHETAAPVLLPRRRRRQVWNLPRREHPRPRLPRAGNTLRRPRGTSGRPQAPSRSHPKTAGPQSPRAKWRYWTWRCLGKRQAKTGKD